ncbi:MAG TPA: urate oxidase [Streptosporangiaceae bacterium]|nr:urate oxidase [Streptosporangiaceae bacterium]
MITLGANQYGKAEVRLVHVRRDGERHEIRDLNVSVALSGDMEDAHLTGDNAAVLPTDTQKNVVYAFAREHGVGAPEEFAALLARHFVAARPAVHRARVGVEEYAWDRIPVTGHSFVRRGQEIRTARVTHSAAGTHIVSGLRDLTVLNSTGSEFWGFARDEYTTLPETRDRVLATTVHAEWRYRAGVAGPGRLDWDESYAGVRRALLEAFAGTHSLSLQQTLYAMGRQVLTTRGDDICEIRLSLPNRHHIAVDLAPFGLDNPNEVFHAADRPYGLIEGTVLDDDAAPAPEAW